MQFRAAVIAQQLLQRLQCFRPTGILDGVGCQGRVDAGFVRRLGGIFLVDLYVFSDLREFPTFDLLC